MADVKPLIVLLPGLDGTGRLFDGVAAVLAEDFEVQIVAYPCDEALDYEALIAYAGERVPRDRPCILLGESFAGPIALHLTAAGQHQIQALILCVTFARYPFWWLIGLDGMIDHLPLEWMRKSPAFRWLFGRDADGTLLQAVDEALASVRPEVIKARMHAVLRMDATPQLVRVKTPILYLRAKHDTVVEASAARYILRHKPEAELHDFASNHFLLQSLPQEAAQRILAFSRALEG